MLLKNICLKKPFTINPPCKVTKKSSKNAFSSALQVRFKKFVSSWGKCYNSAVFELHVRDKNFKNSVHNDAKNLIRKKILALLKKQTEKERVKKSNIILQKLFSALEFQRAKIVLFYASFGGEVETFRMMKKAQKLGKKIGLPSIVRKNKKLIPVLVDDLDQGLEIGPYNIKQPKMNFLNTLKIEDIDLILVPGLAFDKNNNRLGRGAGYYDRFLKEISPDIPTFGLAFDFQILNEVPCHPRQDIPVSQVITN